MVQNLSHQPIRLITDSMSGGGVVHQSFGQSAPGSVPVDGMPSQAQAEEPLAQVMVPADDTPGNDRRLIDRLGQNHPAKDQPFDQSGGWTQVPGLSR